MVWRSHRDRRHPPRILQPGGLGGVVLPSPVPKKLGTGGTLSMVWRSHRDRRHPPAVLILVLEAESTYLAPQFGADGFGDGFGVMAHGGLALGFNHDAGEGFGAAVTDNYAAGVL